MAKKFTGESLEITVVSVEKADLLVTFADGYSESIPTARLVPPARRRQAIDWASARVGRLGASVEISADPPLSISALLLRRTCDPSFAKHLSELAVRQARRIGSRLRDLRAERGMTQGVVARLAQLQPANLSRIESGDSDIAASTLWKILDAMGCTVADLSPLDVNEQKRHPALKHVG